MLSQLLADQLSSSHSDTHCLMESVGALGSPTGANSNLLNLPAPCLWDEDEESLGLEGIRPKSSPIPRRRSSVSSDDSQPPPSGSRRVSFADAFGLSLVSVKQFDAWAVTVPPDPLESDLNEAKEYFMVPLFALPQTGEELDLRVHEKKIELENLELLPGTTTIRGVIHVLNLSFDKMVYVRTSLDSWRSHFDLLAEYVPGSPNGEMDCFSFKLTLVPPFGEEGARVDFCLRYETSLGTFWDNNNGNNFALYCYEKTKEKAEHESENRRKSCLKGSSSNISALTVATTNNMEFPDIILNSGKDTGPESQNNNAEELQKQSKELLEAMSRNRSRRNRRKAARLAKVKEHFARREEKELETKTTGSEVTAEASMQEHVSVPAKEPCSLLQQTPAGPPTCNQISPSPAECLESAECTEDSTHTVKIKQRVQHVQDIVIHSETKPSRAQTDSSLDDTDDLSDQIVSINLPVAGCPNDDLSSGKDVEKAWDDFEQDAKQRIRSKTDKDVNTIKEKPAQNVSLKTNHSVPQLFSHSYAFGTIVAPLYHQVFKNIESERKDFIQRAFHVDRTFKDGSIRAVTAPKSDQDPMRQTTETGPEICGSTKQTQHDGESTEQNPAKTMKQNNNFLSDPYRGKDVQEAVSSHNFYTSGIKETSPNPTNNQTQTKVENTTIQTNDLPLNISKQFPEESQEKTAFVVTQNDLNPCPTQTQQEITSTLNKNPAESPISGTSTENAHLSTMPLVQTEHSYNLSQSPEASEMLQTSSIPLDSSDNKSDFNCSELKLNNEICNFSESECSEALESYQTNESKEQIIVAFCSHDSQSQTSSITDGTNYFYGEQDNTTIIKETENIQKRELVKRDEKECNFSEGLVEEKKGNQAMQMENQEVEDQKQQEEQESAEEELEEISGGINNIVDELKYIDDEEDIDMDVEIENKQNQQSDSVNQQSYAVNQQSDSLNQQSDSVNPQSDLVTQQSYAVNQQSDSVIQQSYAVDQQSDSVIQQSYAVDQRSDSVIQQSYLVIQQSYPVIQQSDSVIQQSYAVNQQSYAVNQQSDSVKQQSDLVNLQSDLVIQQAYTVNQQSDSVNQQSLERPTLFIIKSNNESLEDSSIELDNIEEQQSTVQSHSGDEDSEKEGRDSSNEAEETDEGPGTSWNECSGKALSGSIQGRNDWDHLEFIDKEETVCCEKPQNKCKPSDKNIQENTECQSKDVEDNTSTESLVDDEMELYLTCLRNSQQSVFRDGLTNVNYGKRPSVSRGRSMSLTMPSISESVDEDQPNSSLENESNTDDITELERATLLLMEGNEHVVGRNVLWWKEFLSYDNMSRVVGYSFLLILFLVVAYYYDFVACFALYLLTVYWLFQQREEEPVKGSRRCERQK